MQTELSKERRVPGRVGPRVATLFGRLLHDRAPPGKRLVIYGQNRVIGGKRVSGGC
ncbi:MAG: hypothetical protein U0736_05000 [Gemmataceae bacterium]